MSEWKDISTAPKDGTDIIGCYWCDWGDGTTSYYGPWTMAWRHGKWVPSWDGATVIDYQSDFGTDYKTLDSNPSHWMPLPPPPAPKGEGS